MSSNSVLSAFSESLNYDEDTEVMYIQYTRRSVSCPQHYVVTPCDQTFWRRDSKTIFIGARPKTGTGHKIQTASVLFSMLHC